MAVPTAMSGRLAESDRPRHSGMYWPKPLAASRSGASNGRTVRLAMSHVRMAKPPRPSAAMTGRGSNPGFDSSAAGGIVTPARSAHDDARGTPLVQSPGSIIDSDLGASLSRSTRPRVRRGDGTSGRQHTSVSTGTTALQPPYKLDIPEPSALR